MRILICFTVLFLEGIISSQTIDSLYQRTYPDALDYIGLFDSNILKQFHENTKNRFLYLNNQNIDSSGIKIYAFPKYFKDTILIIGIDTKKVQGVYILNRYKLFMVSIGEIFQEGFSNNLIVVENFNSIYSYKIPELTTFLILNLAEKLGIKSKWIDDNSMIVADEFWINDERLYFNYASCPVSCSDYKHYIFNRSDGSLKELKFLKSKKKLANDEFTCLELVDASHKHVLGFSSRSLDSNLIGRWLFNDTLKRITKLLSMNSSSFIKGPEGKYKYEPPIIAGYNFLKNSVSGINYRNELDNRANVIVPYKFSVPQELAMVKVYDDSLLTREEVSVFGKYELSILRNLIFAKHNFKFDSDYWQAYFNLFEFYRSEEKRKSRTKEVEKLFTSTDKKNIDMIRKEEKKRNK